MVVCRHGKRPGGNGQSSFNKSDLVIVACIPGRNDIVLARIPMIGIGRIVRAGQGKRSVEVPLVLSADETGAHNVKQRRSASINGRLVLRRDGEGRLADRYGKTARCVVVIGRRNFVVNGMVSRLGKTRDGIIISATGSEAVLKDGISSIRRRGGGVHACGLLLGGIGQSAVLNDADVRHIRQNDPEKHVADLVVFAVIQLCVVFA